MATNVATGGVDDGPRDEKPDRPGPGRPADKASAGYFTIYKSGQGYWTRMGSAAAAAILILSTAGFLYEQMRTWPVFQTAEGNAKNGPILAILGAFVAVCAAVVFHVMNKANNADFLIATDSEMRKVNWTSRKELAGSTKIVIIFVVLIAVLLFVMDLVLHTLFYFLTVLKTPPFFLNH